MTDQPPADSPPPHRYGMVRPLQGRYVAGVCAALGQSTRTDPVLWRVILAVLVCFGGIGALAYLVLWILTPEEGDTASPVQALLGRGHSKTSPLLVAVAVVIGLVLLLLILPRPLYLVLLGASVVLVVLLLARQSESDGAPPAAPHPPPTGPHPPPPATATPPVGGTSPPAPQAATPSGPMTTPPYGTTPPPYGTTRPFAPHGPFTPHGPYPPAGRAAAPRERSPLPTLTIFSTLIALGALAVLDLAGPVSVPAAGYVAVALAVTGAGLLIGAWLGRGRALIALGLVLVLALPVTHAASGWDGRGQPVAASVTWLPEQVGDIAPRYGVSLGEGVLDLREVDFNRERVEIRVSVGGGQITVLVPPEVSVVTNSDVLAGEVSVGERTAGGLFTNETITLPASVDPPGGELHLDLRVRFGSIEVIR